MAGKEDKIGVPEQQTEARTFELITKLATLEGKVDNIIANSLTYKTELLRGIDNSILSINNIDIPTMSAKNNLKFSGRADESAEDLIKKIELLKLANGWTDSKTLGNALVTLENEAKLWYEQQDDDFFSPARANADDPIPDPTFAIFKTKFLEKYKEDKSPGDLMFEVLSKKQIRGQSVDDYISAINPKLTKVKNLTEEMRVSLAINGFLPMIQDQLKLKELKTMKDLELWARRIEKMSFIQKSTLSPSVDAIETENNLPDNYEVDAFYTNNARGRGTNRGGNLQKRGRGRGFKRQSPNAGVGNFRGNMRRPISCFGCGGNHRVAECPNTCWNCGGQHFKRDCPNLYEAKSSVTFTGRGRGNAWSNRGNNVNRGAYRGVDRGSYRGSYNGGGRGYYSGRGNYSNVSNFPNTGNYNNTGNYPSTDIYTGTDVYPDSGMNDSQHQPNSTIQLGTQNIDQKN